jgi:hypothetical protein
MMLSKTAEAVPQQTAKSAQRMVLLLGCAESFHEIFRLQGKCQGIKKKGQGLSPSIMEAFSKSVSLTYHGQGYLQAQHQEINFSVSVTPHLVKSQLDYLFLS